MKISLKNNWNEVTLSEFEQIQQILAADISEDYKLVHLLSVLSGESPDTFLNMPLSELMQLNKALSFFEVDIPTVKVKNSYTINGHKYTLKANIPELTTSQFIDYSNYCANNMSAPDVLSVFLIPKGHKYNDGYSIDEVKRDVLDMSIVDIQAISFFIRKQSALFLMIIQHSLTEQMKEMGMSNRQIESDLLPITNLVYSLIV